jgi:hypothetical protein
MLHYIAPIVLIFRSARQWGNPMIRQCAWCLIMMGEIAPLHDKSVTHGICKKCQANMMEEIEKMAKDVRKIA